MIYEGHEQTHIEHFYMSGTVPVPCNIMGLESKVEVNTVPLIVFPNFLHLYFLIHPTMTAIL